MAPPIECPDKFYLVCAFCDQCVPPTHLANKNKKLVSPYFSGFLFVFSQKKAFCFQYTNRPPEGSNGITDDTRLLLYALHEQATKGPCRTPRPWAMFESMDQLKWDAWRTLEDM